MKKLLLASSFLALTAAIAIAQPIPGPPPGGGSVTPSNAVTFSNKSIDGSTNTLTNVPTTALNNSINRQTGTSYTILSGDGGKTVVTENAATITTTLPQANGSFGAGYGLEINNFGAGINNIGTTTSLFGDNTSGLTLVRGQGALLESQNGNWASLVGVPPLSADSILGNATGALKYPGGITLPNCANDGAHGLVYSTSTHSFACASISGSGGGGPSALYLSGNWYTAYPAGTAAGAAGGSYGANLVYVTPFYSPGGATISNLGIRVTTLAAGGNVKLAVYANGASKGAPTGTPICATTDLSVAAVGNISGSCNSGTGVLSAGWYWFEMLSDNTTVVLSAVNGGANVTGAGVGAATQAALSSSATNQGQVLVYASLTYATGFGDQTALSFTQTGANGRSPAGVYQVQ